ncbi:acyl--CoA ligase [Lederbergia sp. NSJ-179]|uniref:class I adenylate-forming enzyme family protein n=1 Tax=Lederbergia sp. NSJ-179 TaxID=2931402 RepID=UPI001FD21A48|nr:class I adenylate-forming enzyme family protein [Lederbergia sp. NSJ-179]MCJ7842493.1 acyl--CoA ligase [Lederbergia sp. NSJ-179]
MNNKTGNFGELFTEAVKQTPNKIAVIDYEARLTYKELNERSNQVASFLQSLGGKKGDRVSLLLPNDFRFIEIIYGTMKLGAIPVPINIKLPPSIISYILEDSEATILFCHHSLLDVLHNLDLERKVNVIQIGGTRRKDIYYYDSLLGGYSTNFETEPVNDHDTCLLLYTSGSTGKPKGCLLTHGGQYWNAEALCEVRELNSSERLLIFAPLYHANALVNIQSTLFAGGSVVILPKVDATMIFEAIEREQVTFMTAVPAIYKMLLSYYRDNKEHNLSSLRFLLCGSSELAQEVVIELEKQFNVSVLESYGLTEGGPVVFSSRRTNQTGQRPFLEALPGVQVQIVDDETPLATNKIGELWVKSPGVAKGYWKLPKVTAERFTDEGWLKTGDLARIDENGHAYIAGRKDDMISVGGENTYPKEVENVLLKHPSVRDVIVTAIPHHLKGQVPIAVVECRTGHSITEKELQDHFFEHGPVYAYPRHIFFLESLPLAGTGKVDKVLLKQYVDEQLKKIKGD